jgi:hypothetical protein
VTFILGAGCSLSAGAPTTAQIDHALREATSARFKGLDLRDALHQMPEQEKQDILLPLFEKVGVNPGYMAIAALATVKPVVAINLNWDLALENACRRARAAVTVVDIVDGPRTSWPSPDGKGLLDLHVHGVIGNSCRFGRLETLTFTEDQQEWLRSHGLDNTLVVLGASLTFETDLTKLFQGHASRDSQSRPQSSHWYFVRGTLADAEDRLRRANFKVQSLTYEVAPDIDFDMVATTIVDHALASLR